MEQLKQLLTAAGIAYKENEPLAAHCTFKIGGPADVFAQPETEEQLCRTIALCKECGVKYYLLGNGSNILFEDAGYHGVVIDTTALKRGRHSGKRLSSGRRTGRSLRCRGSRCGAEAFGPVRCGAGKRPDRAGIRLRHPRYRRRSCLYERRCLRR